MASLRTDEIYNYDEWFNKFITPHPQLSYDSNNIKLLELQKTLMNKYLDNEITKNKAIELYEIYTNLKKNEIKHICSIEHDFKNYINSLNNKKQKNLNDCIENILNSL